MKKVLCGFLLFYTSYSFSLSDGEEPQSRLDQPLIVDHFSETAKYCKLYVMVSMDDFNINEYNGYLIAKKKLLSDKKYLSNASSTLLAVEGAFQLESAEGLACGSDVRVNDLTYIHFVSIKNADSNYLKLHSEENFYSFGNKNTDKIFRFVITRSYNGVPSYGLHYVSNNESEFLKCENNEWCKTATDSSDSLRIRLLPIRKSSKEKATALIESNLP